MSPGIELGGHDSYLSCNWIEHDIWLDSNTTNINRYPSSLNRYQPTKLEGCMDNNNNLEWNESPIHINHKV